MKEKFPEKVVPYIILASTIFASIFLMQVFPLDYKFIIALGVISWGLLFAAEHTADKVNSNSLVIWILFVSGIDIFLVFLFAMLAPSLAFILGIFGISFPLLSKAIIFGYFIPLAVAISIAYKHEKSESVDIRTRIKELGTFFIWLGFWILIFAFIIGFDTVGISTGQKTKSTWLVTICTVFLIFYVSVLAGSLLSLRKPERFEAVNRMSRGNIIMVFFFASFWVIFGAIDIFLILGGYGAYHIGNYLGGGFGAIVGAIFLCFDASVLVAFLSSLKPSANDYQSGLKHLFQKNWDISMIVIFFFLTLFAFVNSGLIPSRLP